MTTPSHKVTTPPPPTKAHHFPPDGAGKRNKTPKDGEPLEDVDPTEYDPRAAPEGTAIGYPDPGDRYPTEGVPYPDPDKVVPALQSLSPSSAAIGDPSFTLRCLGSGFSSVSQIVWNGGVEPTTFVSDTELTTGVDMTTATVAGPIPVLVRTIVQETAPQTFTLNAGPAKSAPVAPAAPKAK